MSLVLRVSTLSPTSKGGLALKNQEDCEKGALFSLSFTLNKVGETIP
jgi:hypothetical protein